MNHSMNLMRICRDASISTSDIQAMVTALGQHRDTGRLSSPRQAKTSKPKLLTSAVAIARTWVASLH